MNPSAESLNCTNNTTTSKREKGKHVLQREMSVSTQKSQE